MDTWLSCIGHLVTLDWRQIAESGMALLPIVKDFDVGKDHSSRGLSCMIMLGMNELHLAGVEFLSPGVIHTISLSAHTILSPRGFQQSLERMAGVLDTLVGMVVEAMTRLTVLDPHGERLENQLLSDPSVHVPAYDFPMVKVQRDRQI